MNHHQLKAKTAYQHGVEELKRKNQLKAKESFILARHLEPKWLEPLLSLVELQLLQPTLFSKAEASGIMKDLLQPGAQKDPRTLYLLAKTKLEKSQMADAIKLLEQAISLNSTFSLARQQLAAVFLKEERWEEAEKLLRQELEKEQITAHNLSNLSIALLRQNRLDESLKISELALGKASIEELSSIHVNLGTILQEMGRRDEAAKHYEIALEFNQLSYNAQLNLGVIAFQNKNFALAEKFYRHCLSIHPSDIRCHVNLAGLLLLQDRNEEGWLHYEKRLQGAENILAIPKHLPMWSGHKLKGDLLLVHEQGLGDTFQFIRYAKILQNTGIRCHFQGPKKLHSLLLEADLVESCCSETETTPSECVAWVALMSLPMLCSRIKEEYTAPYLTTNPNLIEKWNTKFGQHKKLRIALHWQGNPEHEFTISRGRSFPLKTLDALAKLSNIEWISLQKGPGSEQQMYGSFSEKWHPLQTEIDTVWDFKETAAILTCCDGLVCSDSGLAHLAGACGIQTWLLLPWLAEWRWGLTGTKTKWYKNHTLLRQHAEGNWTQPVKDIERLLINQTG